MPDWKKYLLNDSSPEKTDWNKYLITDKKKEEEKPSEIAYSVLGESLSSIQGEIVNYPKGEEEEWVTSEMRNMISEGKWKPGEKETDQMIEQYKQVKVEKKQQEDQNKQLVRSLSEEIIPLIDGYQNEQNQRIKLLDEQIKSEENRVGQLLGDPDWRSKYEEYLANDPHFSKLTKIPELEAEKKQLQNNEVYFNYSKDLINELQGIMDGKNQKLTQGLHQNFIKKVTFEGIRHIVVEYDFPDIAERLKKGEQVSDPEKSALMAYGLLQDAKYNFPNGVGYDVGYGLVEMAPYLLSFAASGGIGKSIEEGANQLLKTGTKKTIDNLIKRGASYAIGQSARVPFFTSFYQGAIERQIGQVELTKENKTPESDIYNESNFTKTKLSSNEENEFEKWMSGEPDSNIYDYRGFYKAEKERGTLKNNINEYIKEPDFHFYSIGVDGKILKSPKHPTYQKTIDAENKLGNNIVIDKDIGLKSVKSLINVGVVEGTAQSKGEAVLKSYLTTMSAITTEQIGEVVAPYYTKLLGKTTQKIPKNFVEKIREPIAFNGFVLEMGEEFADQVITTAIDKRPAKEIFDPRTILVTALTIAPMSGGFYLMDATYRRSVDRNRIDLGKNIDADTKNKIDKVIESEKTEDEKARELEFIINKKKEEGSSHEDIKNMASYSVLQSTNYEAKKAGDYIEEQLVKKQTEKPKEKAAGEIDTSKLNEAQNEQYKDMIQKYGQQRADELISTFMPEVEKYKYTTKEFEQLKKEESEEETKTETRQREEVQKPQKETQKKGSEKSGSTGGIYRNEEIRQEEIPKISREGKETKEINWEQGRKRNFSFDPNSTKNEGRFRLKPPTSISDHFKKGAYTIQGKKTDFISRNKFQDKELPEGIRAIVGKNQQGKEEIQALRFNKKIWPEEKAKQWWEDNQNRFEFNKMEETENAIPQQETENMDANQQAGVVQEMEEKVRYENPQEKIPEETQKEIIPEEEGILPEKDIDFKSAVTKGLEQGIEWLDNIDKELTKFGRETLGVNIPVAVAQTGVRAAKTALQTGKTVSEAIDAAINTLRNSDWYKNLIDPDKQKAENDIKDLFNKKPSQVREEGKVYEEKKEIPKEKEIQREAPKEEKKEKLSGIKKSTVSQEKVEQVDIERKTTQDVLDQAKKMIDEGRVNPSEIVNEINRTNRALQPNEVAALIHYKVSLDNRMVDVTKKIDEARKTNNENIPVLNQQLDIVLGALDSYYEAALKSGYAQSLAFNLRQALEDSEYNLQRQVADYKKVNRGEIPAEIEKKFKDLDRKYKELSAKLKTIESERSEKESQEILNIIKEDSKSRKRKRGDQLINEGFEEFMQAIGGVKMAVGEKRPDAVRALAKIGIGMIDKGLASIEDVIEKIDKFIKSKKLKFDINKYKGDVLNEIKQKKSAFVDKSGKLIVPPDLIRDYVSKGIDDINDLVVAIKKDFGLKLEDREIRDVISGYGKQALMSRDEISEIIREIKRTGKLISAIEDVQSKKKPLKSGLKRDQLTQKEKELRKRLNAAMKDLPVMDEDIVKIKENLKRRISDYQERITNKDFRSAKKEVLLPEDREMDELEVQLEDIKYEYEREKETAKLNNRSLTQKVRDYAVEAFNIPKMLRASLDFSAPLRQGAVLLYSHPKKGRQAFKNMFKYAFSEKEYENFYRELKASDRYFAMKKSGLYLSEPTAKLAAMEEQFMSNLAYKIPVYGYGLKVSSRAYLGFLNKLRVDTFNQGSEYFESLGYNIKDNPEVFKAWAGFINLATGRAKLGFLEPIAKELNAIGFAPRLVASRLALLNPIYYINLPGPVRKMALRDMGIFIGFGMTTLLLAAAAGASVERDPRSADFGKIRWGDLRFDVWAGFQQPIRTFTQFVTGKRKSTTTGDISKISKDVYPYVSRLSVLGSFARSKLSPTVSEIITLIEGENMVGEPVTPLSIVKDLTVPLYMEDVGDIAREEGLAPTISGATAALFGTGVQYYKERDIVRRSVRDGLTLDETLKAAGVQEEKSQWSQFWKTPVREGLKKEPLSPRQKAEIRKKYRIYSKYGLDNKDVNILTKRSVTNEVKAMYLFEMKKDGRKVPLNEWVNNGVISDDVARKYLKLLRDYKKY